jgi:excisionase family DNA binding protein
MDNTELVKAGEAARAVGLSLHYLYRLARAGVAPYYRAGRSMRFDVAELREWMRHQAEGKRAVGVGDGR